MLAGKLTTEEQDAIKAKMESGQFFIAEQVGIPSLCEKLFAFGGGPTAEDHAWHEFDSFQQETFDLLNTENEVTTSAKQLSDAFCAVGNWKPELSPNFK